jgi:hypothetical protein
MAIDLHASSLWVHYAISVVVLLCSQFTVVAPRRESAVVEDTSEIERLLAFTVRDSLSAAHIEPKTAASIMRIDYAQLLRQLRGEPQQHISLTRLIRLPWTFWFAFLPCLANLVLLKRLTVNPLPVYEQQQQERVKRSA